MGRRNRSWQHLVAVCAATSLLVSMLFVAAAYAESSVSASSPEEAQLVADIEQATQAYQDATNTVDDLASQIAQSESHAAEIEQALPAQRDLAAKSIKQLYLFQQSSPGILDLLLSADDFNEFLTALEYLDAIHDHNTTQVTALQSMHDELTQTRATLTMELDAAKQKQSEALKALDTIRVSLDSLRQAAALAAQQSNKAAAQQNTSSALQEAQKIVSTLPEPVAQAVSTPVAEPSTQQGEAQQQTNPEPQQPAEQKPAEEQPAPTDPQTPAAEPTPAPQEQAQDPNVASWAARIDAYLSSYGAPLAGHGATFAQAAAEYGVDPRLSPAIAIIESGGGKVCFLPHNCWGWGSASWPDWDSAIRGHISGFASIYGSTLTPEGAEAYASMDEWAMWYNLLQSEMASI